MHLPISMRKSFASFFKWPAPAWGEKGVGAGAWEMCYVTHST